MRVAAGGGAKVGHVVLGSGIQTELKHMYLMHSREVIFRIAEHSAEDDLDVNVPNEAVAAKAYSVSKKLKFDLGKMNANDSGVSVDQSDWHDRCTIIVRAVDESRRVGGRYVLVAMCIGGALSIAAVFERM